MTSQTGIRRSGALDPLSTPERSRLAELESLVERGLRTFVEVGKALMEIRESRLYRETHGTFETYCRERWGFSKRRGNQLIQAAEVGTMVPVENERQARELVPLLDDEAELVRIYRTARQQFGDDLTASVLSEIASKRFRARVDSAAEADEQERRWVAARQRWADFAAAREAGNVVAERPPRDDKLEAEIEAVARAKCEAEAECERLRKRLAKLRAQRLSADGGVFSLLFASPGSQLVTEDGDVYVSTADGEKIVYGGKQRPSRPGFTTWGLEAAWEPPA